ncbi:hypothetical protein TNCV_4765121 [Trichonephila clavipes]|nr:hypothetical protein TNCV_4765121 [Trichonephila clavipes]
MLLELYASLNEVEIREKTLGVVRSLLPLFPSTNYTRGLAARRLFRVPPCRKGTIHLQTSMPSQGFEPSPYGIAVSVANHYTGWATTSEEMRGTAWIPVDLTDCCF